MPAEFEYLHCPVCSEESSFETPPCSDGHDEACPDRVCTQCGFVLIIGPVPVVVEQAAHRRVA